MPIAGHGPCSEGYDAREVSPLISLTETGTSTLREVTHVDGQRLKPALSIPALLPVNTDEVLRRDVREGSGRSDVVGVMD
jgi:hypothetical protein